MTFPHHHPLAEAGPVPARPAAPRIRRGQVAAVATVAALDLLAHRIDHQAGRTAARYGAAVALLGIARAAGVSWAGLGLGRGDLGSGMRTGLVAGGCAAAAVLAAAALPATRGFLLDERAAGRGGLASGLARITFAAVPPEELSYRSALLGIWLGDGTRAGAVAWSSALFGVSHILPTLSTMSQTALDRHLARRPLRQAAFVAGNVVATSAAGAVFAWLRLRSGSVAAPLLAHAALNDSALIAGRVAHRLGRRVRASPGAPDAGKAAGPDVPSRPPGG
ncbi:MAG TPA: CPBP family intramembrane glutamic endopeptidase [Streptosporangiaceae bacterium]|nr:CPBP family intramembrane glutamic endopeptidase [Streptosporangiaceae bacterium]